MLTTRRLLNRFVQSAVRAIERAGAIQPGTDAAERFGTFGEGSFITFPNGTMYGERAIHLGENTLIGSSCSLLVGYDDRDELLPERGLVIGDNCVIGAGTVLTAHESIVIEDDVWFGQNVFVSDASHGYQDPNTPIGQQLGAHAPVTIGAGSWIGHGAIILPGTTIGRQVVVGAGSVVRGPIEAHAVVAGVPAKVVRRLEPGRGWVSTRDARNVRRTWTTAEVSAALAGETPDFVP